MIILLSICFLALSHLAPQQNSQPDRVRDGFVGAVKSVRRYRADFVQQNGQWVAGDKKFTDVIEYDKNGNLPMKRERYPYFYYCYNDVDIGTTYDRRGLRVDTLTFTSRFNGSLRGKEINTYDENDRMVESVGLSNDGRITNRMVFRRNEKGHTEEVNYYQFEVFIQKYTSTYEYDAMGNWVKETYTRWINESGELRSYPVLIFYREISYY
jgi:hypothetical protein